MRLFLYYSLHSIKNQIKKLFKTWVMVFILVCAVIGGLIGFGAAMLSDMADSDYEAQYQSDDELAVEGDGDEEGEVTDGDSWEEVSLFSGADERDLVEFGAGIVILIVFFYEAFSADKNGSKIFLPADVAILFASPMKPQSVLMFRLMTQIGMIIFASIYLLFQLPNLILNTGMSVWGALALILAWCLTIVLGKLLQLMLYTICTTNMKFKDRLRPFLYAVAALLLGAFVLYWRQSQKEPLAAAISFFNAKGTVWIPFWGWMKGFCVYATEDNLFGSLACLAATVAGMVLMICLIWHIKADFYEDAMQKTEEMAELLAKAQSEKSTGLVFARSKKERSDKLRRDGLKHGWGANVFFYKSLYNRFRFAHLGYFTKTAETYLITAVAVGAFCRFALELDAGSLIPVVMTLGVFVFFRALGNPLEEDTKMDFFRMIPESTWAKVFYSLMGGAVNCLLDLLPAVIVGALLAGTNPLTALAWIPFLVSVDFYATNVGVFINLSVPISAGKTVKQLVQVMFIYFGLLPDIALLAVCAVTLNMGVGAVAAAVFNFGLGFLFFAISPVFLEPKGGT